MAYMSETDEQFFGAFGRVMLTWAHIECSLDLFVAALHWKYGGQHTIERIIPWSLSRKLDYVKRYFRKHYPTFDGTAVICALMDQIAAASETRHDLTHGFVVDHPEGVGEATLVRLLRDSAGGYPTHKRIHVTTQTVLEHAVAASKLARHASEIMQTLFAAIPDQPDKPTSAS